MGTQISIVLALLLCLCVGHWTRLRMRCPVPCRDFPLSEIRYERVTPPKHVKTSPTFNITKKIQFEPYNLITYRFIGAGASGEVFLMQDLLTSEFQVLKRYFKEGRFEEENFIMDQMGYKIKWGHDPVYNNTVSLFPWTESHSLSEVLLDSRDVKLVMFKILRELDTAVNKGFFHMDIKPLNIIVDTVYEDGDYVTKKASVLIIDWNLVNFYYEGAEYNFRRGTSCYQAPELMIWAKHFTPNVDVWSIGVSMYYLVTGKKPMKGCSKDQLGSLIRFVGYPRFKEFYNKMRVESDREVLKVMRDNEDAPGDWDSLLSENPSLDNETIAVIKRMLVLDPLQRASFHELLSDPYFDDVKSLSTPYLQKQRKKRLKAREAQELRELAQNID